MEVLHCEKCGTRLYDGYEAYGKKMWRPTEYSGVNGGFFEFFNETSGEWYDTGIYYTTFQ